MQYDDHEQIHRRVEVDAPGERPAVARREQLTEHSRGEADDEAAERRRPQPVDAPDHDTDQHDDRLPQPVVGGDDRRLHGQDHRHGGGEQTGDHHRDCDHDVRS